MMEVCYKSNTIVIKMNKQTPSTRKETYLRVQFEAKMNSLTVSRLF